MTIHLVRGRAPGRRRSRLAGSLVVLAAVGLGLVPSPAGAADPATAEEWVALTYRTCLDREPDPAGLDHWMERYGVPDVQGGAQQIAGAVCWGEEALAPTIAETFTWILDRGPSAADLAYWTPRIRGRRPLHVVERHVFASAERYAASGGTDAAYVEDLYHRILDRPAGAGDLAYWVGRLGSGEHRVRTVDALLGTPEAWRARTIRLVDAAVGRAPTETELGDGLYVLRVFRDLRLVKIAFLHLVVLAVP